MKRKALRFRIFLSFIIITNLIPWISCQRESASKIRPHLLEQVDRYAIVRCYADGFENLPLKQKILAYYLTRAAIAGRDIFYDQNHRYALEIRDLFEELYLHGKAIEPELFRKITKYLKLFWINSGNYDDRTKRKFVPDFSFEDLKEAVRIAQSHGADFKTLSDATLSKKLERLQPFIFDPLVEPLVTNKSPDPPLDMISGSANNFYYHLTLEEVEQFSSQGKEKHPLNARLIKADHEIVEEVYRAGSDEYPPGLYAEEIERIIDSLEQALPYAEEKQAQALRKLIRFYRTGEREDWINYNIAWVAYNSVVDMISGFIETYRDPRGIKGSFEGIVHMVNREKTDLLKKMAQKAKYFEERMPWNDLYKREEVQIPVANAVDLLVAVGDGGPMCSIGINLPNEQEIRERYGSKSVSIQNVMEAYRMAFAKKVNEEFALPEERKEAEKYGIIYDWLLTSMHEILGHASGKVSEKLAREPSFYLKEYANALEEARADLVALYHLFDRALIEMGALPDMKAAEAGYRSYARAGLVMLRRLKGVEEIEDDHMRALNLIVNYLKQVTGAIHDVQIDGKTYFKVVHIPLMREGIAELLSEVMRIKAEGDYEAAQKLFETYGIHFDRTLRDEVVRRAEKADIPDYAAFVLPDLIPIRDGKGNILDIEISNASDFATQMLRYSGKKPSL